MRRFLVLILLLFPCLSYAQDVGPVGHPVLVLGDSLSAAYRIPSDAGWVHLLATRLNQAGASPRRVVNASISGETTAGGLARLPKLLRDNQPGFVLIELGANDGLRGLPLPEIRANLLALLQQSRDASAQGVLIGIELPVNYGPQYRDGLRTMYRDLATEFNVPLVPFLLQDVVDDPDLLQDDGLHPTAQAQPALLETVWRVLQPALATKATGESASHIDHRR